MLCARYLASCSCRYYLNVFNPGDALGWHMDNSAFSVSLTLQVCRDVVSS